MNNLTSMSGRELWGLMADTAGIFALIFFFKSQLDGTVSELQLPVRFDFYFVSFWAFVAAVGGGFLWNSVLRIVNYDNVLGGSGNEPHGMWALLWPIITLLPTVIILMLGNKIYPFMDARRQILLYLTFLVGASVGSTIFYNLSIGSFQGFRSYLEAQNLSPLREEFFLVLIWTGLLSIGFLMTLIVRLLIEQNLPFLPAFYSFLRQAGFTILFTMLAVIFFLLAFEAEPRFDVARGIVAGLFFRIAIFWGLLITYG